MPTTPRRRRQKTTTWCDVPPAQKQRPGNSCARDAKDKARSIIAPRNGNDDGNDDISVGTLGTHSPTRSLFIFKEAFLK